MLKILLLTDKISEYWHIIRPVLTVIIILSAVQQCVARAEWRAEARVHQKRADQLADSVIKSDSVALAAQKALQIQDSIRRSQNRADSITIARLQRDRVREAQKSDSLATSLEVRLAADTAASREFTEYRSSTQTQLAKSDSIGQANLERAERAERQLLFAQRLDVGRLEAIAFRDNQIASLQSAVSALDRASSPFSIDIGSDWFKIVGAFIVGYGTAEALNR